MKSITELVRDTSCESTIDPTILETHSHDWSLFRINPAVVVFPKNADEVGQVVRAVSGARREDPSNKHLSVTPRAAGSDMTGGPLNHGVIMDVTRYMNRVDDALVGDFGSQQSFFGHTYPIRGMVMVEPGCFYRNLEPVTHAVGLEMACYPASRDLAAVGGMVANNGAGEKSLKYGQNKDFVHALRVVLHDGNEYEIKPLTYVEFVELLRVGGVDMEQYVNSRSHSRAGGNPVSQNLDPGSQPHTSALPGMTGTTDVSTLAQIYAQVYSEVRDNWQLIQSKKPTTSKNSAGYLLWDILSTSPTEFESGNGVFDPTRLFVGAQGTTGIITEITYKLVPVEKRTKLLVAYIDDLALVPTVVERLMKYDVEMLEMYDDNTFKIGIKFFRDFIRDKGLWGAIKYSVRFLPELMMVLRGGIPKLIVLAEFVSNDESEIIREVYAAQKSLSDLPIRTRVVLRAVGEEKFWDFRHDSFKLLTEHSLTTRASGTGTRTAPFIDDIAVNPEFLPQYLPRVIQILDREEFVYTIAGHLGNGNFHIIPLMDMKLPENRAKIVRVSTEVYKLALEYGASITAEHNDGIVRTPFLPLQFGPEMIQLFQRVKDIMDPLGIFNPGKKVGGTIADIEQYME